MTLESELDRLAATPILIAACDFDGVLAPIVPTPDLATAEPDTLHALRELAGMSQTFAAVLSGRALADLRARCEARGDFWLAGSHGAEWEDPEAGSPPPTAEQTALRDRIAGELERIAATAPGFLVEAKPLGVAFHYRNADAADAGRAVAAVNRLAESLPGVSRRDGKMVIELSATDEHKGAAVARLRHRLGATGIVFIGDDRTDEDAFAALQPGNDLAVKVGPGESAAVHRVPDTGAVAGVLAHLAHKRREWLASIAQPGIERHSILSDQRTVALVDPRGRVGWFCAPRIDSPPLFADMLGGCAGGYFEVRPADGVAEATQEYDGDSFVLKTRFKDFTIVDYLDCAGGRAFQRAGRTDLVRVLEPHAAGAAPRVRIAFAPRLDFGRTPTRLKAHEGALEVEGWPDPIVLRAPGVSWTFTEEGKHQTAAAEIDLTAPLVIELRYGTANQRAAALAEPARRTATQKFWSGWAATLALPALHEHLVRRSALVLKALCYGPSGAICAAGTCSLPEWPGGVRNWDYRFCWPRDAAMAAAALVRLGTTGQAMKLLDWLLGVVEDMESPERLRPIYTVTGSSLGPEGEVSEVCGYRHSRPVRVGNAAGQQVQLDVFGPIVELAALLADRGAPLSPEHWRLVEAMVTAVAKRWQEPDHGIWEIRDVRRHHVHSKVMCWTTVDRALVLAEAHLGKQPHTWRSLRDAIAQDVLAHGWKPSLNAFSGTYEQDHIDASALFVGLNGLVPPDDPRFLGTVQAVERHLREGPTVYRYRYDDALPGLEGGFHICACWLAESFALVGRADEARALLDEVAALAGPTGLLPEQYSPRLKMSLGNHPQAYSHLGLINATLRLVAGAKEGTGVSRPTVAT